ncbi:MAG: Ppx/GppA phosphatase family protein [Verrucomicrobiota bacterium]|jgi:exopolyphosphatase/guanosine-5'-triphosphate,3'-diphosphate pyrophosphatase
MEPVRRACSAEASTLGRRRAVIDIGTNSIKLLVADVAGRDVQPVHEESQQTRLGKGFYETHRLQPDAIARTAEAVAEFAKTARENKTTSIHVIATSAVRDAVNPGDLTSAIERASGLKVEIIPGEREAELAFQGVTTDPELAQAPLLLLDVGGGSTEFILGQGEHKHFAHSFPLGTVRLMEKFPHNDPPTRDEFTACRDWIRDFLKNEVRPKLEPAFADEAASARRMSALRRETGSKSAEIQLVGTGGTTSILARIESKLDRYDRERIEATRLDLEQVKAHRRHLWSLPLAGRKEIVGLPKLHVDVILTGVLIYEAVMEKFGFTQLRVSTRGLRFAAVMD